MKKYRYTYLILLFSVISMSCGQKRFDSEKELWTYVKTPENGYYHEKEIGQVKYTLTYRPTDILVRQELPKEFTEQMVDSLRKKYGEYLYFNLSMSANNRELLSNRVGSKGTYSAMVNELTFGMGDKVHLISQTRDTIGLLDYVYPRMYGMGRNTDILLVYPKGDNFLKEEYFLLTIEDLGFATGEVTFKIDTKTLSKEPRLNFERTL